MVRSLGNSREISTGLVRRKTPTWTSALPGAFLDRPCPGKPARAPAVPGTLPIGLAELRLGWMPTEGLTAGADFDAGTRLRPPFRTSQPILRTNQPSKRPPGPFGTLRGGQNCANRRSLRTIEPSSHSIRGFHPLHSSFQPFDFRFQPLHLSFQPLHGGRELCEPAVPSHKETAERLAAWFQLLDGERFLCETAARSHKGRPQPLFSERQSAGSDRAHRAAQMKADAGVGAPRAFFDRACREVMQVAAPSSCPRASGSG